MGMLLFDLVAAAESDSLRAETQCHWEFQEATLDVSQMASQRLARMHFVALRSDPSRFRLILVALARQRRVSFVPDDRLPA
jgi:hypothetical protein